MANSNNTATAYDQLTDPVVIERMPEHLRASHEAAGNWGRYPHNGAERRVMSREDAESLVAGDSYDHIRGPADLEDAANYGVEVLS